MRVMISAVVIAVVVALSMAMMPTYFRCMGEQGWFSLTSKTICQARAWKSLVHLD